MALFFGKKKEEPTSATPTTNGAGGKEANGLPPVATGAGAGSFGFEPDKARKFFEHAKTVDATDNFEYALQSWLSGMKFDPMSTEGIEGFFGSMAKFLGSTGGKKGVGKEVQNVIAGKSDLERYLTALLEWGQKPTEQTLAVRAISLRPRIITGKDMKTEYAATTNGRWPDI